jgi:hypothetical protein
MPNIIAESLRLAVSVRRINAFLAAEDRDDAAVGTVTKDEDNAIEVMLIAHLLHDLIFPLTLATGT